MVPHNVTSLLSLYYLGTACPTEALKSMDSAKSSISICHQVKPATIIIPVLKYTIAHARNMLHLIRETDQIPALLNSFRNAVSFNASVKRPFQQHLAVTA